MGERDPEAVGRPGSAVEFYLRQLRGAIARPPNDPERALDAFLSFTAGLFLADRLPRRTAVRLHRRLAGTLDGLDGLPLPRDSTPALQLAQHVREIAAALGPVRWAVELIERTEHLVPSQLEDWDAQIIVAARRLVRDGGDALLAVHARRRMWELSHPGPTMAPGSRVAAQVLRRAAGTAASWCLRTGDGRAVQVAEAVVAEVGAAPALAGDLLPALQAYQPSLR